MTQTCNCGDTSVSFHPDENQHEPNCWICYDNKGNSANVTNITSPDEALVKPPSDDDYNGDLPF